jgi:hypothetical protein
MTILQLLNILLFWLFFGLLASFLAKKKRRNPVTWFFFGLFFGLIGALVLFLLPPVPLKRPPPTPARPLRSDVWLKMWYYLDSSHQKQGPFEFSDFAKFWKEERFHETSLVWGEGMGTEWKRLVDLPELTQEIKDYKI